MDSHPESPAPHHQEHSPSIDTSEIARRERKSATSVQVSTHLADQGYDIPPTQVESWLIRRYLHILQSSLQHNLDCISQDQPAPHTAAADLQPVATLADQFQLPVPAIEDLLSDPIEINSKHSLPLHTWLSWRATALSRHYHAYHQTAEPSARAAIGDIQKEIHSRITSHLEAQDLARKEASTLSPKEQILQSLHATREGSSLAPLHDTLTEIWHRAVDPQASFLDQARTFAQLLPHHTDSVTKQHTLLEAQDPHRTIHRRGKETLSSSL